jgi:hypothetical protein
MTLIETCSLLSKGMEHGLLLGLVKVEVYSTMVVCWCQTHSSIASGQPSFFFKIDEYTLIQYAVQEITYGGFYDACRYLDQLGMASKYNTKVFCRQTLIGGNYGLLDTETFLPNPDYYR